MDISNTCNATIFEGPGIIAFQNARNHAGKYGVIGSVPIIALLRMNSSNLESRIWNLTFATSTIIQVLLDKKEGRDVIVSHGPIYDFMREVSADSMIYLNREQTDIINSNLVDIPIYHYTELLKTPLQDLPLQYQIWIKQSSLKEPEDLAIALFGHPQTYKEFKEKYFGDKMCFETTELFDWLSEILKQESFSWATLLHFGDKLFGIYSDYIAVEKEGNFVLGINCSEEIGIADCADYLKSSKNLYGY